MGRKATNISGNRYGRWAVLYRTNSTQPAMWMCRCDCGEERSVWDGDLKRGYSMSCGCLKKEISKEQATTHGMTKTKEYRSWGHIIQRCENKNNDKFKDYGGRGISVCVEWRNDFMAFLVDMGLAPFPSSSIERMDNEKGYSKNNCKWGSKEEQANNTRIVRIMSYKNCPMTVTQALNVSGEKISRTTVNWRLSKGWDLEKAIHTPVNINYSRF